MKRCGRCGGEFPATLEHFPRAAKGDRLGLGSWCRKCCSRYIIERRKTNPAAAEAHRQERLQRYRRDRLEVLCRYGGTPPRCVCCDEHIIEFLTVDHVNNDGARERRELGYRSGELYRVLKRRG